MKNLLLIEDDAVLRENTAELLSFSNYLVHTAADGKKGVKLALEILPDIIICDIMMPELDGYEVLKMISKNKKTNHIPFIFLSAKTEHKDVRKGMNLGADDYITKPFTEEELVNAIESRLAKVAILKDEEITDLHLKKNEKNNVSSLQDLKKFFNDYGDLFAYHKNDTIYNEGENANFIYLLTKGIVKCCRFDEKGKELTTSLYKENNLFGFTSFTQNIPYRESAKAIEDVELIGVQKKELTQILLKDHKVALALIELLTDNIFGIKNQLLEMAYSSVHKKTASTILKFAEKMNTETVNHITISRNDLASVAGIATETLIRTLSFFKKEGIIDIEGRSIKIISLEKLKHIS